MLKAEFSKDNSQWTSWFRALGLLLCPFVLRLIPIEFFLNGVSPCLFKNFFSLDCPGCGMTRATIYALKGYWSKAYEMNRGITIVGPVLIFVWLKFLSNFLRKKDSK
jgi:hypothetical protein